MAIYTTFVEPEDRPTLRNHLNVWAVVDDADEHIIAYCLHAKDAERLKALLVYYSEHYAEMIPVMATDHNAEKPLSESKTVMETCPGCGGTGQGDLGDCEDCKGSGQLVGPQV